MTVYAGQSAGLRSISDTHRVVILTFAAAVAAGLFGALVLLLELASFAILLTWVVVAATLWRPRLGLLLVLALITLFEAGGADALMVFGDYFHGGLASRAGLPGAIASPLELLLILTLLSAVAHQLVSRRRLLAGGAFAAPMLILLAVLVAGQVRGAVAGGDLTIALWESRYLFYIVVCYLVVVNTVRTEAHVNAMTGVFLAGTALYAVEGAYRRVALVDTGSLGVIREFAYSHEVVVFLVAAIILVLAQQIFGAPRWQRIIGMLALPVLSFTLLATERRAGILVLIVCFVAFALLLLVTRRAAFFLLAVPLMLSFVLYLPLFWNSGGIAGQPARAVRSLVQPDSRDAQSDTYRRLETMNVRATILSDPVFGVGFGREFLMVVPLADLSWWPFWRYEPHNQVLWVWLKTGMYGFVAFWALMGIALATAANAARRLSRSSSRTFAVLALSVIVGSLVFSYVDLGLVSGRVTVVLGSVLGVLGVIKRIDSEAVA
jgi:O-antigen ligase